MDFRLSSLSIKRLIYLFLVTVIALLIAYHYSSNSQWYWVMWSAYLLSLIPLNKRFVFSLCSLVCTAFIAILLGLIAGILSVNMPALVVYLVIVTALSVWLSQKNTILALQIVITAIFIILWIGWMPTSQHENSDRAYFSLIGMMIAIILHCLAWPYFNKNALQFANLLVLHDLARLNAEIFACFLQPEYPNNEYLFERRLYLQKDQVLHSLKNLSSTIAVLTQNKSMDKHSTLTDLLVALRMIYNILLDCSELRWRVSDHSTFAVCSPELNAILTEINTLFLETERIFARKKYHLHTAMLAEKITKLEESYHNVLRVAAPEPLVFLLFMSSLRALNEEILKLKEVSLKVRLEWL